MDQPDRQDVYRPATRPEHRQVHGSGRPVAGAGRTGSSRTLLTLWTTEAPRESFQYGDAVTSLRSPRPVQLPRRARHRRAAAAGVVAVALIWTVGCAPEPAPTPTPTPAFASEEEAFAAAEEVYRAYNDAGNARRAGKDHLDPQHHLTGTALEGDIEAQNLLDSHGLRVVGDAEVISFTGESMEANGPEISIVGLVCLDVSSVTLLSDAGQDVTPIERGDVVAQRVSFLGSGESLLISDESSAESNEC